MNKNSLFFKNNILKRSKIQKQSKGLVNGATGKDNKKLFRWQPISCRIAASRK